MIVFVHSQLLVQLQQLPNQTVEMEFLTPFVAIVTIARLQTVSWFLKNASAVAKFRRQTVHKDRSLTPHVVRAQSRYAKYKSAQIPITDGMHNYAAANLPCNAQTVLHQTMHARARKEFDQKVLIKSL